MQKQFSYIALALLLILALAFLGCNQPVVPEKTSEIIEINANESIAFGTETEGALTEFAGEWGAGDCSQKIKAGIDALLVLISAGTAGENPDSDLEQATALLQEIKETTKCTFTKGEETGKLKIIVAFSKETIALLNTLSEESGQEQAIGFSIEKLSSGNITARISHAEQSEGSLKLKVEGQITDIYPLDYHTEEEYLVFDYIPKNIELEFSPQAEQAAGADFTLIIIIVAAVIIVLAIILFWLEKKKKIGGIQKILFWKKTGAKTLLPEPEKSQKKKGSGFFSFMGKAREKSLFDKKRELMQELEEAEHKFLKRQISEESYKVLMETKQRELIKIDAMISQREKSRDVPKGELVDVEPKSRHVLKALLQEKEKNQKEMELAQTKYLKRKIDEKTYLNLLHGSQSRSIEIDAKIKSLKGNRDIKSIFDDLKAKLRENETTLKQSEHEEIERIAKEILDQSNPHKRR